MAPDPEAFDPRRFLAEIERVAPRAFVGSRAGGFTFARPPAEALAALSALPDRAGVDAVLEALGHDRREA
jgi:hypothetical protein